MEAVVELVAAADEAAAALEAKVAARLALGDVKLRGLLVLDQYVSIRVRIVVDFCELPQRIALV